MRSSLTGIRPGLTSFSQMAGSTSAIRPNNNTISKQPKMNYTEQFGGMLERIINNGLEPVRMSGPNSNLVFKKYETGDTYYGQIENDMPQGEGIYVWDSVNNKLPYFYKGNFDNGQMSGFGKLYKILDNKYAMYCYQGYWKNAKREGEGVENYNSASTVVYKGAFSNDQRHGKGTLTFPDGSYQGSWNSGKMNGQGKYTATKGPFKTVVQGRWADDDIRQGTIDYFTKSNQKIGSYQGSIKNLQRHGEGNFSTNLYSITGKFIQDQPVQDCFITATDGNGHQYTLNGDFHTLKNIMAEIKYANKDSYKGLVEVTPNHVVRRTKGKYYFGNGNVAEGEFDDNEKGQLKYKK